MSTILDRIVADKRFEVAASRELVPLAELERQIEELPPVRDLQGALSVGPGVQVLAEVKAASPSAGVIRTDFDPVAVARRYQEHGAAGVSVKSRAVPPADPTPSGNGSAEPVGGASRSPSALDVRKRSP